MNTSLSNSSHISLGSHFVKLCLLLTLPSSSSYERSLAIQLLRSKIDQLNINDHCNGIAQELLQSRATSHLLRSLVAGTTHDQASHPEVAGAVQCIAAVLALGCRDAKVAATVRRAVPSLAALLARPDMLPEVRAYTADMVYGICAHPPGCSPVQRARLLHALVSGYAAGAASTTAACDSSVQTAAYALQHAAHTARPSAVQCMPACITMWAPSTVLGLLCTLQDASHGQLSRHTAVLHTWLQGSTAMWPEQLGSAVYIAAAQAVVNPAAPVEDSELAACLRHWWTSGALGSCRGALLRILSSPSIPGHVRVAALQLTASGLAQFGAAWMLAPAATPDRGATASTSAPPPGQRKLALADDEASALLRLLGSELVLSLEACREPPHDSGTHAPCALHGAHVMAIAAAAAFRSAIIAWSEFVSTSLSAHDGQLAAGIADSAVQAEWQTAVSTTHVKLRACIIDGVHGLAAALQDAALAVQPSAGCGTQLLTTIHACLPAMLQWLLEEPASAAVEACDTIAAVLSCAQPWPSASEVHQALPALEQAMNLDSIAAPFPELTESAVTRSHMTGSTTADDSVLVHILPALALITRDQVTCAAASTPALLRPAIDWTQLWARDAAVARMAQQQQQGRAEKTHPASAVHPSMAPVVCAAIELLATQESCTVHLRNLQCTALMDACVGAQAAACASTSTKHWLPAVSMSVSAGLLLYQHVSLDLQARVSRAVCAALLAALHSRQLAELDELANLAAQRAANWTPQLCSFDCEQLTAAVAQHKHVHSGAEEMSGWGRLAAALLPSAAVGVAT